MGTAPLFIPEHLSVLTTFALSNVLLAFDYDGTLAPIASRPRDARMREGTRQLLTSVAVTYPTIVISGRSLEDLSARLAGIPLWHMFGNHGIESSADTPAAASTATWVRRLKREIPTDLGVRIEDKRHTVTVHYRGVRDRARAIGAINAAVAHLGDVTVVGGKDAVNLLPAGSGDKGAALKYALTAFACSHAIYVGDEETDESVFDAFGQNQVLGVRIEPSEGSRARFHLTSQVDVDRLLGTLLDVRAGSRRLPAPFAPQA